METMDGLDWAVDRTPTRRQGIGVDIVTQQVGETEARRSHAFA